MSQTQNPNLPPEDCYDDDEINLIDFIHPIYKGCKFLIIFCLTITFFTGVISVFSEKLYNAKAVILPEVGDTNNDTGVKAAFLEQFGIAGLGGAQTTSSAVFGAVLKSKELAWGVLSRYDYYYVAGIVQEDDKKKLAKGFSEDVIVLESKDDPSISISMQVNDPVLASDIANSYVQALDEYNLANSYTSTRRLREYIENRLIVADEELDSAQKGLREFQEKNKAISINKQAAATLNVLEELEKQRVSLELEKAAKEKFRKGPHIEIEQLDAQIEAVNKNIDRLTSSENSTVPLEKEKGKVEFYVPLIKIPALNYDESKLLLKVKAKTAVITMLTTQLEQAKLDETKDMPTLNILESAAPPEKPIKPKKKLYIMLGFLISFSVGVLLLYLIDFIKKLDHHFQSSSKWQEIKYGITSLLSFKNKYGKSVLKK